MESIRAATEADLRAIAALRRSVGWNVYRWALLDAMRPPQARMYVIEERGEVVAIGSGIAYGRLGVVGNMVVSTAHRGRGLGRCVLQAVIAFLEERGCSQLELYATADGRRLYGHYGFELSGPSVAVTLPRQIAEGLPSDGVVTEGAAPGDLERLASYDAPRFGADRSPILAAALADPERPVLIASHGGSILGYAVLRPDGTRLGPFVADEPGVAGALLATAAPLAPRVEAIGAQLPCENVAGIEWLEEIGARIEPWDGRMRRGSGVERRDGTIYGSAIGALG
ncbi:MAG: GNAT family N-acetyltransferase [Chloroflexota bacterium]|nr:GNAT family N-acetyltransferase [Chloroflexota bacterium]